MDINTKSRIFIGCTKGILKTEVLKMRIKCEGCGVDIVISGVDFERGLYAKLCPKCLRAGKTGKKSADSVGNSSEGKDRLFGGSGFEGKKGK